MYCLRTIPRIIVVLAVCVFTLLSVAFSQEQVNSTYLKGKKDGSTKQADTTRILNTQGAAGGASAAKIRIDSNGQELHLPTTRIYGESGKNIVEIAPQSSGEYHGSEGVFVETYKTNVDTTILNLNNSAEKNSNSIGDGWNSNTATTIQIAKMTDGTSQLTINCQNEPVYVMKYFEVIAGTDYEIFLDYSGQEADLAIEEFNSINQRTVNKIQHTPLEQIRGKQFAMKFRTGNQTQRILFKIQVSSSGKFILNKFILRPVMSIMKRER